MVLAFEFNRMEKRVQTRLGLSTSAILDLFIALGLLGVYLKAALLDQHWEAVVRFLGIHDKADLTLFQTLGFFHSDIILNLLVLPIAATALFSLVFGRHKVAAATVATATLSVIYYVELRAQNQVGQYIARDVVGDLIGWGVALPGMTWDYVGLGSLVEFAALLVVILAIAGIARLARTAEQDQRVDAARWYGVALRVPALVVVSGAAMLATIGFFSRLPGSHLNDSAIGRAFVALVTPGHQLDSSRLLTYEQTLEATRQQTKSPRLDPTHTLVGHEDGSDLLIFMMETGPAQALDVAQVGGTLPGVGPLYSRSFVAQEHYTTHPYSSDAMYSILSGLYPQGRRRLLRGVGEGHVNALMTALQTDVPVRRVYVPRFYNIRLDARMYAILGAESVYAADEQSSDPMRTVASQRADALVAELGAAGSDLTPRTAEELRSRLLLDFQALERVKADITEAVRRGQRYAVLFFPQIGHGPWLPLHGEEDVRERGRALMLLQDAWLKELVDTIRDLGRLERTVIALTADHGIRTRAEDPALQVGRISDFMFRVPLLIYAPQTLEATYRVPAPTSHVDFAPTLAALLGKVDSAKRMQGVPIWQRAAANRLYLLGSAYGGADGFVENGSYYMHQGLSGAVYCSRALSFGDEDQAQPGAPVVGLVTGALAEAADLQQALVSRILRGPRPQ
jgi:hypothetical protein